VEEKNMDGHEMKIGVIGLWHLGCVLSAAWSKLGFQVVGFDDDSNLIGKLSKGKAPLYEPGLNETLSESMSRERLVFTDQVEMLGDCDIVFLAYDTPVLENDESDLTLLKRAVVECSTTLKDGAVMIVSSQSPAGTCQQFRAILQEANPTLDLAYSPENLRLGQAIECYLEPGRIILGVDSDLARSKASAIFQFIEADLQVMGLASAEMVKHGINSFLANSIVFANHLADICETVGADVLDVVQGMKSDARIGPQAYLSAGIGFSGGTLGRDLKVLSGLNRKGNTTARLFDNLYHYNDERCNVIVDKVTTLLGSDLSGRVVGVLGLTYKPGTSTLRRSLPLAVVERLQQKGCQVQAFDPKADYNEMDAPPEFRVCQSIEEAIQEVDLVLLLTEWPEFAAFDWINAKQEMRRPMLFDAKNFLAHQKLGDHGFHYQGIGRIKGGQHVAVGK